VAFLLRRLVEKSLHTERPCKERPCKERPRRERPRRERPRRERPECRSALASNR
jgi:hypothetical protein